MGNIGQVVPLLVSVFIVFAASGLQIALVPARAVLEGFSPPMIGLLGALFYLGVIAGGWIIPWAVKRAGHIRTFGALCAVAASIATAYPWLPEPIAWAVLRAVAGVTIAGLYMVPESWLNEAATNETRGRLFSLYVSLQMAAIVAGQMSLGLGDPAGHGLFALMTVVFALAMLPLTLTTATQPKPIETPDLDLKRLFRLSPIGAVGVMLVGALHGSLFTVGPVYGQITLDDANGGAWFLSAAVVGGILAQYPFGRLSDRIDRRWVVVLLAGIAAATAAPFLLGPLPPLTSLVLAGLFGAACFPLYAVLVAHANDFAAPEDFVRIGCGLVTLFGIGAIGGPLAASLLMELLWIEAMWLWFLILIGMLAGFTLVRMSRRAAPSEAEKDRFVAVSRTATVAIELDPRAEPVETADVGSDSPSVSSPARSSREG